MLLYELKYIFSKNWIHAIYEKRGNEVFDLFVLILSQVFHKELLFNALCVYLFNILFSPSLFTFYSIYMPLCLVQYKADPQEMW